MSWPGTAARAAEAAIQTPEPDARASAGRPNLAQNRFVGPPLEGAWWTSGRRRCPADGDTAHLPLRHAPRLPRGRLRRSPVPHAMLDFPAMRDLINVHLRTLHPRRLFRVLAEQGRGPCDASLRQRAPSAMTGWRGTAGAHLPPDPDREGRLRRGEGLGDGLGGLGAELTPDPVTYSRIMQQSTGRLSRVSR